MLWQRSPTNEEHRATPLELFFELVYIYAATQVTAYMAYERSLHGVIQGLLLLALLWATLGGLHLAGHSPADPGSGAARPCRGGLMAGGVRSPARWPAVGGDRGAAARRCCAGVGRASRWTWRPRSAAI